MKGLVEVYEEMAASTMKKIREAILASRGYYHGLARLSAEVGADLSEVSEQEKKKEAIVLLSADSGLYGDIVDRVFDSFLMAVRADKKADVFISGKVGEQLMRMLAPELHYTLIPGPIVSGGEVLTDVVRKLYFYKKVQVFFGQFESLAQQNPTSRMISAAAVEWTRKQWAGELTMKLKFIYEPTPEKISQVFSEQIFFGIFEQTLKEDELAKNGSRLMHLDQAYVNIEKKLGGDTERYRKLLKRLSNKKQQSRLTGYEIIKRRRKAYV